MDNKVSIIVPIYNVELYLEKCVNSLINQTYNNIEIYLVDDGSTDGSGSLCDKLSKRDKRIRVIHKENGGYGSVLEYAIKNISGDYFLICDPDDWLELDAIETLIYTMVKYNTDLVVARKKLVFLDGTIKSDKDSFKKLKSNKLYYDLINFLCIPCSPHSKLYKTKLCQDIKFPKKINNTDYLLYQVYLTKINSAVYIDQELSNYFIERPGNSFSEDINFTEKSLKSNSVVSASTFEQINKKSKLYVYSLVNLFIRTSICLACMKKYNVKNEEYYKINMKIIENLNFSKKDLYNYLKAYSRNRIKCLIKMLIFIKIMDKKERNFGIYLLSKISWLIY